MELVSIAEFVLIGAMTATLHGCGQSSTPEPPKPPPVPMGNYLGFNLLSGDFVESTRSDKPLPQAHDSPSFASSSYIAFSSDEAVQDLAKQFGIDISGQAGAFSGNADMQTTRESLEGHTTIKMQGEMYTELVYQEADLSAEDMLSLTPEIVDAIGKLPSKTDPNDLATWVAFFNTYGTEFISKQYLGGRMHLKFKATLDETTLTDEFKSSFKLGAQGTFEDIIKLPVSMKTSCTDEDKRRFQSKTGSQSQSVQTIGGDPAAGNSWDDWKGTVKANPAAVRHEYSPIYKLVDRVGVRKGWSAEETQSRKEAMTDGRDQFLQICPAACSGHGLCHLSKKQCSCDQHFSGDDCSKMSCAHDCGDHGTCDTSKGECKCEDGWKSHDPDSPCSQDCRSKAYHGDHDCNGQTLLQNPRYSKSGGYASSIGTCLNQCSDRWGCNCGQPAADKFCQIMMKDDQAKSTDNEVGDPNCDWGFLSDCTYDDPWNIGDDEWDIGVGSCSGTGVEPAHPDVFASITCKPGCASDDDEGKPVTVILHSNSSRFSVKKANRTQVVV